MYTKPEYGKTFLCHKILLIFNVGSGRVIMMLRLSAQGPSAQGLSAQGPSAQRLSAQEDRVPSGLSAQETERPGD